jgi:ParB family chromosome partitioning protein
MEPEVETADITRIPVRVIVPNPMQPRQMFTEAELVDLSASIQVNGLLQPLVVRLSPEAPGRYELIAGERRLRAVGRLGWTDVPVVIREASDETLLILALVENLQREALNALEEAEGYQALTDNFGMSQGEIAEAVGKDRSTAPGARSAVAGARARPACGRGSGPRGRARSKGRSGGVVRQGGRAEVRGGCQEEAELDERPCGSCGSRPRGCAAGAPRH